MCSGTRNNPPTCVQNVPCTIGNWSPRAVAPLRIGMGGEVRRLFHKFRSLAIEPFNGVFKNGCAWRGQMPVKGLRRCQRLALGAIVLYQIVLLYQHQRQRPSGVGVKALLRAA
jgi:hypothetical protein